MRRNRRWKASILGDFQQLFFFIAGAAQHSTPKAAGAAGATGGSLGSSLGASTVQRWGKIAPRALNLNWLRLALPVVGLWALQGFEGSFRARLGLVS